jgi:hypothetical protein
MIWTYDQSDYCIYYGEIPQVYYGHLLREILQVYYGIYYGKYYGKYYEEHPHHHRSPPDQMVGDGLKMVVLIVPNPKNGSSHPSHIASSVIG